MIRKIQSIIILAAVAFCSTGCLEKLPEQAITDENAITNIAEAEQAITGIYAAFKSSSLYSGLLTLLPDIQADLVYAVEGYSNTYGDIWRWEILANNTDITAVYGALYTVIGRCNFFLAYVESLRAGITVDEDLDALQEMEGDVYMARALAYSELIKLYCKAYDPATADSEPGVVIVTDYYNPEPATRSSLKKSYEFVLDDLAKAEEYIERESLDFVSYFTKTTVNALYARLYLYMQDWDNAIEYSTKVIEDDVLYLASTTPISSNAPSDYTYMWTNDSGPEIIWRVGFTPTSYGGALGRVFLNYNRIIYTPDYVPATWALSLYSTSDKRYEAFFRSTPTGYYHGLTWPLLIKYEGNETFRNNYNILHVNMPKVFRLSEQYLIRAEAYCRQKEYTKAGRDITSIRVARYTTYGSTRLSEDNWLEEISKERVRELFMEGFRLNDLKRWGKGFERTSQQSTIEEGSSLKVAADDPLFVWPIPQHELDAPGADIQPNESNQ